MMVSALSRPVQLSSQPAVARRELAGMLREASWDGDADGVILAVHEAMVNAQRHGGGITRATAGFEGRNVVVEITDRGKDFSVPDSPAVADVGAETGRGLFLIRHLAADAKVVRTGRNVSLILTFGT